MLQYSKYRLSSDSAKILSVFLIPTRTLVTYLQFSVADLLYGNTGITSISTRLRRLATTGSVIGTLTSK